MDPDFYYVAYTDASHSCITVKESYSDWRFNEVNELTFKSSTQAVQYARKLAEHFNKTYVPFTGTPDTRGYIYL